MCVHVCSCVFCWMWHIYCEFETLYYYHHYYYYYLCFEVWLYQHYYLCRVMMDIRYVAQRISLCNITQYQRSGLTMESVHDVHYTVYIMQYISYGVHVQCITYKVQCITYTQWLTYTQSYVVQCTMYNVQCILYGV